MNARADVEVVVDGVAAVLGPRLIGAYVADPEALDVVVVVDAEPDDASRALLVAGHQPTRLTVRFAPAADLRSPMTLGRRWWRAEPASGELALSETGNSAHARWVLRERGLAVRGPAPRDLVAEVTAEALRAEALGLARARAEELEDDPSGYLSVGSRAQVVLTSCRVLHTAVHAEVVSETEAARWARDYLDAVHRPVADAALAASADPDTGFVDDADQVPAPSVRALVWDVVRLAGTAALDLRHGP